MHTLHQHPTPPATPAATAPATLDDPPSNEPVTPVRALQFGMLITTMVARWFWHQNQRLYQRAGFDLEDIEGHLRYYILTARFLPTVERQPGYYSEKSFRASLYVSCRKACFAHYRKNVKALKRGLALKDGASVPLDEVQEDGYVRQLPDASTYSNAVLDRLEVPVGECMLDRMLAWVGVGGTWAELVPFLPLPTDEVANLGRRLRSHIFDAVPAHA